MAADDYDSAIVKFQKIIQEHPDATLAWRKLSDVYFYADRKEQAKIYFQSQLIDESNKPYALYCLARLDLKAERYDDAITKLKQINRTDQVLNVTLRWSRFCGNLQSLLDFFRENSCSLGPVAVCYNLFWVASFYILKQFIEVGVVA